MKARAADLHAFPIATQEIYADAQKHCETVQTLLLSLVDFGEFCLPPGEVRIIDFFVCVLPRCSRQYTYPGIPSHRVDARL